MRHWAMVIAHASVSIGPVEFATSHVLGALTMKLRITNLVVVVAIMSLSASAQSTSSDRVQLDLQSRMRPLGSSSRTTIPSSLPAPRRLRTDQPSRLGPSVSASPKRSQIRRVQPDNWQETSWAKAGQFNQPNMRRQPPGQQVYQAAYAQGGAGFSLPPNGTVGSPPAANATPIVPFGGAGASGQPPSGTSAAPSSRNLQEFVPPNPPSTADISGRTLPQTSPSQPAFQDPRVNQQVLPNSQVLPNNADLSPVPQPNLVGGDFATIYNCPNISPASAYQASLVNGCGTVIPAGALQTAPYVPPPAQLPAPAVMPPLAANPSITTVPPVGSIPGTSAAAPAGALVSFGQETYPVQVGQGLWGQPVAYVPGQSIRNWLRYLSP